MFVKICGIRDVGTARVAVDAGADAIGFVHHPASPRHLEAADIRAIIGELADNDVETVLVVRRLPIGKVLEVARASGVRTVQFHGGEDEADLQQARDEGFQVIRALALTDYLTDYRAGPSSSSIGTRLLLDAPDPGHGHLLGAEEFTRIPATPWILAGGLSADNVQAQIRALGPAGVDVSSGVESSRGVKDHALVTRFVTNARSV